MGCVCNGNGLRGRMYARAVSYCMPLKKHIRIIVEEKEEHVTHTWIKIGDRKCAFFKKVIESTEHWYCILHSHLSIYEYQNPQSAIPPTPPPPFYTSAPSIHRSTIQFCPRPKFPSIHPSIHLSSSLPSPSITNRNRIFLS